jgi:hypothetical protein
LVQLFACYDILSWVTCCLCSEHKFLLWARLKIVDGKICLSFEYKSCSLFNLDVCRIFVFYHCYCGIKVIKMKSISAAAIGWRGLFLPVVRWAHRIVVLVDCFMCIVVLVLRMAYGQVVLLRTVLNFVAWQLEKASNIVTWSTRFHLLYKLPPLNFRILMSQITW